MIIPIEAATDGYINTVLNTLSIASNGYLMSITIIDVPRGGGMPMSTGGGGIKDKRKLLAQEIIDKKIIVVVNINNKEYTKTKIVRNKPNLSINDINVIVNRDNIKPKIKIELMKKV